MTQLLPKSKQRLLNQLRSNPTDLDDSEELILDLDLITSYRRPEVVENPWCCDDSDDEPLPDHILQRLAQIRELAMQEYRKVHGA